MLCGATHVASRRRRRLRQVLIGHLPLTFLSRPYSPRPPGYASIACNCAMSPETVSPETTTPKAPTWHITTVAGALADEDVKPDTGLTESYVQARQGQFGRNVLAEAKREPKWRGLSIF